MESAHPQELTDDSLLGGKVRLRQPARGYRANADTVFLAAAVTGGSPMLEAGCGVGGALLCVAACQGDAALTGVERDPPMAALARENVAANGFADRVRIVAGDVFAPPEDLGVFGAIFFNPPYDAPGEGRLPAPEKRAAHVADRPIGEWIKLLSNKLEGGGVLTLIHRPERLAEILAALEGRLGGAEVLPVHPFAGAPARRVLVRARKGSRAPLRLLAGLNLHPSDSAAKHTAEAEAILRGEAAIPW